MEENKIKLHLLDESLVDRVFRKNDVYCVSKRYIQISPSDYDTYVKPLQSKYNGRYMSNDGTDRQYYYFRSEAEAQAFARDFFLHTLGSSIDNKRIPFTGLVVRKDEYSDTLYHIIRDTGEDGRFPILAYYDLNDKSIRTPLISSKLEMKCAGEWAGAGTGYSFYFKSMNDLHMFNEENRDRSVRETFANSIVTVRYDSGSVAVEKRQTIEQTTHLEEETLKEETDGKQERDIHQTDDKDSGEKTDDSEVRLRGADADDGGGDSSETVVKPAVTDGQGDGGANQQQDGESGEQPLRASRGADVSAEGGRQGGDGGDPKGYTERNPGDDASEVGNVHQEPDGRDGQKENSRGADTAGVRATVPADGEQATGTGRGAGVGNSKGIHYGELPIEGKPASSFVNIPETPQNTGAWLFDENPDVFKSELGKAWALDENIEAMTLLATLLEERRLATREEQNILARYCGWGNARLPFTQDIRYMADGADRNRVKSVQEICDRMERATSSMSASELAMFGLEAPLQGDRLRSGLVLSQETAFYTYRGYNRAIFEAVGKLGFAGGDVLEPASGTGDIISSMDRETAAKVRITSVELEPVSALINKNLHPESAVRVGRFQDQRFGASNSQKFSLTITNCPFASIAVADEFLPRELDVTTHYLHTYFPAKMLDRTLNGGLMAVVVTSNLLDNRSHEGTRKALAELGQFVGGVRLPSNAFDNARVNADILIFRKWNTGEDKTQIHDFVHSVKREVKDEDTDRTVSCSLNEYFERNPDNILGRGSIVSGQFGPEFIYTSEDSDKDNISRLLSERLGSVVDTYLEKSNSRTISIESPEPTYEETLTPQQRRKHEMFNALAATFDELCRVSSVEGTEEEQKELRSRLNLQYDNFVGLYAARITEKSGRGLKHKDLYENPNFTKLAALEVTDTETGRISKARIFFENTIRPIAVSFSSQVPQDVINYCYQKRNRIIPEVMESQLGSDWLEKCRGLIFLNPANSRYEAAAYYLSGDVKTKLEEALGAAETDPRFLENVESLRKVQPADIDIADITVIFGANYVPSDYYREYIADTFLGGASTSQFSINYRGSGFGTPYELGEFKVPKYRLDSLTFGKGSFTRSASEVILAALNNRTMKVNMPGPEGPDGKPTKVLDVEETDSANAKIQEIRNGFEDWLALPKNSAKVKVIADNYNRLYNRTIPTEYKTNFVEPVGCTIDFRPHQKEAIARGLLGDDLLLDHSPGLGKTYILTGLAMEMKRTGLAQKTLLICMKANVQDIAKDFLKAYPNANILCPSEADFAKKNRHTFLNRIKTNSYDCVILSHDQYCKLRHSEAAVERVVDEYFADYENVLAEKRKRLEEDPYASNAKTLANEIRQLEKARETFVTNINSANNGNTKNPKDPITFEELGFDKIMVDESHQFKNLKFVTGLEQVSGLGSAAGSSKALMLLLGVRSIQHVNGGDRGVVFASGTPIVNSLVEMYNQIKYLKPSYLEMVDQRSVDAWLGQCGIISTETEITALMKTKDVTRVRAFANVPEMQKAYHMFADVKDNEDAKLDRPVAENIMLRVHSDAFDKKLMDETLSVAQSGYSGLLNVSLQGDAMSAKDIVAINLAKLSAMSSQLVIPQSEGRSEVTKVDVAAGNIAELYHKTTEQKGVQFVFSDIIGSKVKVEAEAVDIEVEDAEDNAVSSVDDDARQDKVMDKLGLQGTPYSVYEDLKAQLIEKGVKADEILIMRDMKNDRERAAAIKRLNEGGFRIAMGSTQVLGTGVNAQQFCVAVHNLDVPWTPSALDQRNGRGVRQGNMYAKNFNNNVVPVYYYVKEKSIDAKLYDLVHIKANFINQIKKNPNIERTSEAVELSDSDLIQAISIAFGNKYFEQQLNMKKDLTLLERQSKAFTKRMASLNSKISQLQTQRAGYFADTRSLQAEIKYAKENGWHDSKEGPNSAAMKINGRDYPNEPKKNGDIILTCLQQGHVCEMEAYGYKAALVRVNLMEADFVIKGRTGESNVEGLNDKILARYTRRLTLQDDVTHAGLTFRSIMETIEKDSANVGKKLGQIADQLEILTGERESHSTFAEAERLEKMKAEKLFVDAVCAGTLPIDSNLYGKLSREWEGMNPDAIRYGELQGASSRDCIEWFGNNVQELIRKYVEVAEEISSVVVAHDNWQITPKYSPLAGREASIYGPLVIDSEIARSVLSPIAEKVGEYQVGKLADRLVKSMYDRITEDQSRIVKVVSSNDPVTLGRFADPRSEVCRETNALAGCDVMVATSRPMDFFRDDSTELIHVQTDIKDAVFNLYERNRKCDSAVYPDPVRFVEDIRSVEETVKSLAGMSSSITVFEARSNDDRSVSFSETREFQKTTDERMIEASRAFLERRYDEHGNELSDEFLTGFATFASRVDLYVSLDLARKAAITLKSEELNGIVPAKASIEQSAMLYSMSMKDLVEFPTPDNRIHLLAESGKGLEKVVPDPFIYAASAGSFLNPLFSGDHIAITIDKEEIRPLLGSRELCDSLAVWQDLANNNGNRAYPMLKDILREQGISFAESVLPDMEFKKRQMLLDIVAGAKPMGIDGGYSTPSSQYVLLSVPTEYREFVDKALPMSVYRIKESGSERNVAFPSLAPRLDILSGQRQATFLGETVPAKQISIEDSRSSSYNMFRDCPIGVNSVAVGYDRRELQAKLVEEQGRVRAERLEESLRNGRFCGYSLSPADISNLRNVGQLNHTVEINNLLAVEKKPMLLYIDRMSSTVRPYDPSSLMIDNSKKEALNLSDDDMARILEGKQIECMVNGQQAYLLINPNEKSVSATLEKAPFRESWEMPGTELKASETESVYKDYSQDDSEVKNGRNLGV